MRLKKLIHTALIFVVAGVAISGVADGVSQTYAEQALKRALTTFAVARTLNGVISVAQGTEVALEPGGVGVILTPGQVLDPVNDLVERFSSVMLVAASSLGLQIILLEILSWWVVTAMLVIALLFTLATLLSPDLLEKKYVRTIPRLALLLVVIRFAIPVVIISSNFLFETFLLSKHDAAATELTTSSIRIEELSAQFEDTKKFDEVDSDENDDSKGEESGETWSGGDILEVWNAAISTVKNTAADWTAGVKEWLSSISVSATFAQLEESAAQATSHIVNLIVIFVLQTIIFPLAFLWLFVATLKAFAARSLSFISGEQGQHADATS